ncbi:hypothetical protein RN96_00695 [Fusobacterium polymorphum]|uniref:Uncharacterized protein n=1 Tax=Fusobacterium nucleatum subsp. polymorphum TaxID=76857 RepID=A0A2B7YL83_FUSNP|nr:hypothetical protein [Fusobacterium polymorphum]PGH21783.1 hypothetical protein RN96_00695 [Fusobacterium polymorphum]
MLKAKFVDKILEVMQEEADRIWIDSKEVTVCFKDNKDVDGNAEILKHIYKLQLNKVVGEYRVLIDYEHEIVETHRNNKFVCLRNFKSCDNKIWTSILEEIEKDKVKNNENKS